MLTPRALRIRHEAEIERLRNRIRELEDALYDAALPMPPDWRLTPTEWRVFKVLVSVPLASRRAIMVALYPDRYDDLPVDKIVDSYISGLRRKLGPHGVTIFTQYGHGWRLDQLTRDRFKPERRTLDRVNGSR